MKTLVVIPCYNHEKLCNQLLSNINNHHILIIDDCSSNILSIQKNNNHIKFTEYYSSSIVRVFIEKAWISVFSILPKAA